MKRLTSILAIVSFLALGACGGGEAEQPEEPKMKISNSTRTPEKPKAPAGTEDAEANAMENKGIGPVEELELAAVDQGLVTEGESLFTKNCSACHKVEKRYIGPPVAGVTERRTPEWIMNMMLNPTEMIQKDPLAKKLMAEYNGAVMADQNLTEEQARAILEYFRTL